MNEQTVVEKKRNSPLLLQGACRRGRNSHVDPAGVTLTSANVHDSPECENVVCGDEEMAMADKAYWSKARSKWCGQHGVANGILRKPSRGTEAAPGDDPV